MSTYNIASIPDKNRKRVFFNRSLWADVVSYNEKEEKHKYNRKSREQRNVFVPL